MGYTYELYDEAKHYATISEWLAYEGAYAPHESQIATTGVIALKDGKPAAYVCVYAVQDASIVFLDWLAIDPGLKALHKYTATKYLIRTVESLIKHNDGNTIIRGYTWSETLRDVCVDKLGYHAVEGNHYAVTKLIESTNEGESLWEQQQG